MFVLRLAARRVRRACSGVLRFVRARRRSSGTPAARAAFADRVRGDLAVELPDEDIGQDLSDCLDAYVLGSKPRCEEVEYLEMVQDAIDRIDRGR
ncbi:MULTISPECIES: hypothetical protein [Streptomyces]|uniref:Uncharacterized protein n=1 Tax=Streptomyces luteosporeus TaxID=173856 RepID=A0ABN3TQ93_9ACTN